MAPEDIETAVRARYPKFLADVEASLRRNQHMNDITNTTDLSGLTTDKVTKVLDKLMLETTFSSARSVDVLMSMKKGATYARSAGSLEKLFEQDVLDAILVQFINYCGTSAGVDLALYTCDIKEP